LSNTMIGASVVPMVALSSGSFGYCRRMPVLRYDSTQRL
jgi:hypothetical protein